MIGDGMMFGSADVMCYCLLSTRSFNSKDIHNSFEIIYDVCHIKTYSQKTESDNGDTKFYNKNSTSKLERVLTKCSP